MFPVLARSATKPEGICISCIHIPVWPSPRYLVQDKRNALKFISTPEQSIRVGASTPDMKQTNVFPNVNYEPYDKHHQNVLNVAVSGSKMQNMATIHMLDNILIIYEFLC